MTTAAAAAAAGTAEATRSEVEWLRAENARLTALFRQRCELDARCGMQRTEEAGGEFDETASHTVVILGASGDLAIKKLFPALFGLHHGGLLPRRCTIVGYARSELSPEGFRAKVASRLPPKQAEAVPSFLSRLHYIRGGYEEADFRLLSQRLAELEGAADDSVVAAQAKIKANRLFYVSLPPAAFVGAIQALHAGCTPAPGGGWTRIVVEKPFGHDLQSARQLQCAVAALFDEASVFRIDHYLGKQMVMNLLAMRFANIVFSPLWGRQYVSCVQITFKVSGGYVFVVIIGGTRFTLPHIYCSVVVCTGGYWDRRTWSIL